MKCPICGADWTRDKHTPSANMIVHSGACENGHRVMTFEVFPSMLATQSELVARMASIEQRRARWRRDLRIARDQRTSQEIAAEHNISPTRVRQIRTAMRSRLSARRGG